MATENPTISPVFKTASDLAPVCSSIAPEEVEFTLVTQLSMNRLWIMKHHCERWGDYPISVAVGTSASRKVISKALATMGCNLSQMSITVEGGFESDEDYPVNKLRNLALSGVKTSHAVFIDADFLLSQDLHDKLMETRGNLTNPLNTIVIPAFEFRSLCDATEADCKSMHESLMPRSKQDLVDLYASPSVTPTIIPFDWTGNPSGHGSTRYIDWVSQSESELLPITCITSPRYEPYLVIRYCHDMPPFQEAFTGYGQNKLTWFQQLRRSGYNLQQLGSGFLVHFPHKKSDSFKKWNKGKNPTTNSSKKSSSATNGNISKDIAGDETNHIDAYLRVERIALSFTDWMEATIPDKSVLPQC